MEDFQKLITEGLEEHINIKLVLKKALREKYKKFSIEINESKLEELVDLIESRPDEILSFDIDDRYIIKPEGFSADKLEIEVNDDDLLKAQDEILSQIPKITEDLIEETVNDLLRTLRKKFPDVLKDREETEKKFEDSIKKYWGKPLKLLEIFVSLTLEYGAEFNNYYGKAAKNRNDQVIEVLFSLFARACQVASEVIVLLKAGFADGAHARWRTLHEIAVVAQFIDKHGATTAERYLAHECVEDYKGAKQHQEYFKATKSVPLTAKELNKMKTKFDMAVRKYGQSFKGSYGWAALALNSNNPNFGDIEKDIGLDAWRPTYKLASHNVHANPMGITVKLGRLPEDNTSLLTGQSLLGLDEAGHGIALSLMKVISALLFRKSNLDVIIYVKILFKLEKEIGREFRSASDKLLFGK